MTRDEFKAELASLVRDLIPDIGDDYRASDDPSDDTPGMQITIGADANGWSYQTGDNSYTGGAYGYAYWGLGSIYRDSDPDDVAESMLSDLESQPDDSNHFFFYELIDVRAKAAALELFAALKALVLRCDGPEGVRADGSNIDTQAAHALLERVENGPD
jgi:hypothetical protein